MSDYDFDVVIVGAGVVGCCCARELARWDLRICVLEAGLDIAMGSTRANSGIVHAGYDPLPGTKKALYNVRGAQLYPEWARDLGFVYWKNGALVVAFSENEITVLHELEQRAKENGASPVSVIDQEKLRELEPNVSPEAIAALHVPDSAICDPYGITYAAAENAADNGIEFKFAHRVVSVERENTVQAATQGATQAATQGTAQGAVQSTAQGAVQSTAQAAIQAAAQEPTNELGTPTYLITCANGAQFHTRTVLNAAGIFADEINNMVSSHKLAITPRRGEYKLYENTIHPFSHTMFQAPSVQGKGVLVGTAAFGNLFCGPNAQDQISRTDVSTTRAGLDYVEDAAARTWPDIHNAPVITEFAGLRATNADTGDFVIGEAPDAPGFFNAACIDSPGLASAPAIATDLSAAIGSYLQAEQRSNFNPTRVPAPIMSILDEETKASIVKQDSRYGNTVCSCCHTTEGEIVAALHRALPILCFDALKWRTGITMGPCQSGRCAGKILGIIARELGIDASEISRKLPGAPFVTTAPCATPCVAPEYTPDTYEKTRFQYDIPGARVAGVYSARKTLDLMLLTGCLPGTHALVWGSSDLADCCAAQLLDAGAKVEHIDRGHIVEIRGEGRVTQVDIAFEEEANNADSASQSHKEIHNADAASIIQTFDCDLLVISNEIITL